MMLQIKFVCDRLTGYDDINVESVDGRMHYGNFSVLTQSNFRKFIFNIVFELSSKYLKNKISSILKHILIRSIFGKNYY